MIFDFLLGCALILVPLIVMINMGLSYWMFLEVPLILLGIAMIWASLRTSNCWGEGR